MSLKNSCFWGTLIWWDEVHDSYQDMEVLFKNLFTHQNRIQLAASMCRDLPLCALDSAAPRSILTLQRRQWGSPRLLRITKSNKAGQVSRPVAHPTLSISYLHNTLFTSNNSFWWQVVIEWNYSPLFLFFSYCPRKYFYSYGHFVVGGKY